MEILIIAALAFVGYKFANMNAAPAVPPPVTPPKNPDSAPSKPTGAEVGPSGGGYGPSEPWVYAFARALREADGQTWDISDPYKTKWTGGTLNDGALRVMLGHAAVETGNGTFLFDNNAWNMIEVRKGYPYKVRTDKGSATDVDKSREGSQQNFAVFATPKDCAARYLSLIRAYYPAALLGAIRGDAAAYAKGLKNGKEGRKWYEAPEGPMAAAIAARMPSAAEVA